MGRACFLRDIFSSLNGRIFDEFQGAGRMKLELNVTVQSPDLLTLSGQSNQRVVRVNAIWTLHCSLTLTDDCIPLFSHRLSRRNRHMVRRQLTAI